MIVQKNEQENQDILVTILRSQILIFRVVKASAATEGLTIQQFGVLRILSLRGALPMNALGEELMVRPPVITGIVDRLEAKGLVKRTGDSSDRRKTEILLNDEGKKVYRKVRGDYATSLHGSLQRSLTLVEQERLAGLLRKFVAEIHIR